MAIETGLIALGAAIGGKELIVKLFGPLADDYGDELAKFSRRRISNLNNIFAKTKIKLKDNIDANGSIPPIVFKEIIDKGSLYEEEIFAEYYSGILASSRTPDGRDDRGKTFSQVVNRLSRYQLRAHYIFYTLFKNKYNGVADCTLLSNMESMVIEISNNDLAISLDLNSHEQKQFNTIISHIMGGLQREFLINQYWSVLDAKNSGWVCKVCPEVNGYELYLWAQGKGDIPPENFTDANISFEIINDILIPVTS